MASSVESITSQGPCDLHKIRGRINAIEAMRTVICLWVVFCHYYARREEVDNSFAANLIYNNQGAAYGFVVLSGFITHWTSRDQVFGTLPQVGGFYWRRFTRVFMAYEVAILMGFLLRFPANIQGAEYSVATHVKYYIINFFALQAWFDQTSSIVYEGPLFHLSPPMWTISALAFCWFTYPMFARFVIKRGSLIISLCLLALTIAIALYFRTIHPGSITDHSTGWGDFQGFYWYPPHVLELFLLGVFGAEVAATIPPDMLRGLHFAVLIDVMFVMFVVMNGTNWDVGYWHLPFSFDCYCRTLWLLAGCIISTQTESLILGSPWFMFSEMSKYSLAIYVFQTPISNLAGGFIHGYPIEAWTYFRTPARFGFYLLILFSFSVTYYHFAESKTAARRQCDTKEISDERLPLIKADTLPPSA